MIEKIIISFHNVHQRETFYLNSLQFCFLHFNQQWHHAGSNFNPRLLWWYSTCTDILRSKLFCKLETWKVWLIDRSSFEDRTALSAAKTLKASVPSQIFKTFLQINTKNYLNFAFRNTRASCEPDIHSRLFENIRQRDIFFSIQRR